MFVNSIIASLYSDIDRRENCSKQHVFRNHKQQRHTVLCLEKRGFSKCFWSVLLCCSYQNGDVCLCCADNHVRHIAFVSRRVEKCEAALFGLIVCSSDFDGFAFRLFFFDAVHDVSEPPRFSVLVFGFFLETLNCALIDHSSLPKQLTRDGGFTSVCEIK